MIDTDKYEGHTEGPWTVDESLMRFAITSANIELVKDAPLLLAEVKRLRYALLIHNICPTCHDTNGEDNCCKEWRMMKND